MKKAAKALAHPVRVLMESEVARQVRQHSRSSMKAEVCGVLIGREEGALTIVDACIAGANAAQGGAHVTFTQDTWEHIYQVKDKEYPDARIVGWYHSHPGFGVFLSDHDLFIHEHFFSSPQQIAWVYDPHNDEEGCFGWRDKTIAKIDDVAFRFVQPCGEAVSAFSEGEEVIRVKTREKEDPIDLWSVMRYAAICLVCFVMGGAAALLYVDNRAVLVPRGRAALVIVQDDQAMIVPPLLANHMLDIMQREAQFQMDQQRSEDRSHAEKPATGASGTVQGGQDDRKR
jgi:proteasome lid subunit RPN8/RPN11